MGAAVGHPYGEHPTFPAGYVLQDRFRILRFLARGGAGEVYEAFDTELRCPVALKLVRPEVATNDSAVERFRREIALARQITHPNVSRIFDVFRVELPSPKTGAGPIQTLFLTMELLVGESLASRIHRLGPLSPAQALPLIIDMMEGLKAAHRAGVIHRDLKSANIVLARHNDEVRAVIMDFGLAQERTQDPDDPYPLTNSGVVVGTPNYMSPEQLTGGEITPAVDQYSLGIVIFEMLTGQRPFRGENEVATAVKRLTERPPSPRSIRPDLDQHWDKTILRMLEVEPENRFHRLDDIIHSLVGTTMPIRIPGGARRRRKKVRSSLLFFLAGVLLIAVALSQAVPMIVSRRLAAPTLAQTLKAQQGRAPLTIGSLQPISVDEPYEWITNSLSGLLAHALHGDGMEVSWVPAGPDAETASAPNDPHAERAALNAPLYVGGTYRLDPALDRVTLDLVVVDDLPARRITVTGPLSRLAETSERAARAVRAALGLPQRSDELPPSALLERVALREARSGRLHSALKLRQERRELGQPSASNLSELSYLLKRVGSGDAARQAANDALSAPAGTDRERTLADAVAVWALGDLETARKGIAAVSREQPDDSGLAVRRAALELEAGDLAEALTILSALSDDERALMPRADILLAQAYNQQKSYSRALSASNSALSRLTDGGTELLRAEALLQRGRARVGMGDIDYAARDLNDARAALGPIKAAPLRAQVLRTLIDLERQRGSLGAAATYSTELEALRPAGAP